MSLIPGSCGRLAVRMASYCCRCCCRPLLLLAPCCGALIQACLSSFTDISPAELDALWREPPYALEGSNEHFPGNYIMTKGSEEGEEVPGGDSEEGGLEPVSYWKRKEALLRSSTVSLGVGERFFSEIALVFSGRRRSTEIPDSSLQEALRTRLRVVESNSQDVIQLFKDLSARLVSVHAEKDRFLLTFKTVEEVWKFSTYLALGYVARCLENFLFDQTFWLDPEMLSDLEINVSVDEEHLATLYLGLLVQEGSFFAKALCRSSDQDEELEVEEELSFQRNDLLMVRDTGQEAMWEGTLLSTGTHGLVPVKSMQPLPYPFYQWFLRKYPGMAGCSPADKEHFEHPIVSGTCMAVEDYSPLGQDELQLSQGDVVEIRGLLVRGLDMFIGTHTSSGTTGFIRKSHVRPLDVIPLDGQLVFLTEDERAALAQVNPCSAQPSEPNSLLERLFSSDISSVYRLDRLDDCDFMFIRNRPKQDHKGLASARQSLISERSAGTPSFQHHHSTYSLPSPRAPVSPLARPSRPASYHPSLTSLRLGPAEPPSFIRDDPFRELDEFQEDPALFLEDYSWEAEEAAAELSNPTLNLLDHPEFQEEYAPLYDLQHSFLEVTFGGQNEEELLAHLENVREAAKRSGRPWAHRRACFLLGRLCARRHKYSQARVYYEESLNVNVDGFSDTPLLTALYINLTAVYLKQRMTDKLPHTLEKACAMLLCSPRHSFTSLDEVELLNVLLRRSVVQGDKHLEARVCYLALSLFLALHKTDDALPFIERLQFLMLTMADAEGRATVAPLDLNWLLSQLYHRKYMPFLALASLSLDSRQDHSLLDTFHRVDVFIRNSGRLNSRWREGSALLPAHIVIYLQQALAVAEQGRDWETQRDLCLGLASVYQQYGALEKAVGYAQQAVETGGYINAEEGFQASVQLGWLLVLTGQTDRALDTLQPLLTSLQGTDSPTQRGVIHNLLALCLRRQARVQEAGRHLHSALAISRESGNQRNQALALANLGCLAIDTGASCLAERYLIRSLRLFWDLAENPSEEEHVQTYMWLGRSYKDTGRSRDARACYELGLLIALHAKNLHGQMVVAKVLSRLYADMLLYAQSIIYYEHCVSVSRQLKDKRLEGEYLEILSNLYLSLNTEKSSRKSLDYTKQSLRISIDLGKREEESETWLQVGRIYYLIHEDELADMYLQAAVKTALRMNDPHFAMSIYEEAGDVFFKGHRGRMASLPFFRDGSLPFARSIRDVHSEFRLLSKLTELLMTQGDQQEALQYATLAAQIASKTGVSVNERTAYHRLATVYYRLQQYEMAENYYLKSLSLCTSPEVLHPIQARYFTKVYTRLGDITLYQLKDAFDAVGYFHLALAAALEDRASPRALYVVYMKLAEIHAHHLPDPRLLKSYRDRAHSLSRILAGEAPPWGVAEGGTGETGGGSRGPGDVARLGPTTPAAHCQAARRAAESEGTEERVSGDGAEVSGDSGAEAEEDSARSQTETEWADCLGGDEEDEERRRRRRRRMEGLAEGRGVCNAILLRSLRQSASESTHTESFATAREYVTDPGPYDPQGDADRTDNGLEMSSHANSPADPASGSEPNQHSDADTGNISHGASGEIDSIPVDTPSPTKMVSGAKTGRRVDNTCDRDADVCKGVTEGDINVIFSGGGAPASPSNMDQKLISDILSGHAAIATAGNSKTETVSKAMDALNKHMESDHMNT